MCVLNLFLMHNFELILACIAMSDQTQLICGSITEKLILYLYLFLRYWAFRNPEQSGWLQEFWAITQDLELL